MHEMSLAEGVLQIIEDAASRQNISRVTEVNLEIGVLSGVEVQALEFCLEVVLKNSIAERAKVTIDRVAGKGFCLACGESVPLNALFDPCPQCGSYQVQPTAGKEMQVKDLLVE
jgi:hydrogenase nickel incorporation protein HypA/HybF